MERLFIETKFVTDDTGAISGIAWKYNEPDRVGDMIAPGTLTKARFPIPMLAFHDMNDPVGTWDAGEDRDGAFHVKGRLQIEDVERAREVRALVRSGAIKGLSVGFITGKAESRKGGRLIKSLDLLEISLVTFGMHPGAIVTSAKSATSALRLAAALNRATAQIERN